MRTSPRYAAFRCDARCAARPDRASRWRHQLVVLVPGVRAPGRVRLRNQKDPTVLGREGASFGSSARENLRLKWKRPQPRWSLIMTLATAAAFHVPMPTSSLTARPCATNVMPVRVSARRTYGLRPRRTTPTMAGTNTLSRTIEEEERRIGLWKGRFGLSDDQISALRESFQVC